MGGEACSAGNRWRGYVVVCGRAFMAIPSRPAFVIIRSDRRDYHHLYLQHSSQQCAHSVACHKLIARITSWAVRVKPNVFTAFEDLAIITDKSRYCSELAAVCINGVTRFERMVRHQELLSIYDELLAHGTACSVSEVSLIWPETPTMNSPGTGGRKAKIRKASVAPH